MTKKDLKNLVRIRLDYFRKAMNLLGRVMPGSFIAGRLQELQPQISTAAETSERNADLERAAMMLITACQAADMLFLDQPELATRGVVTVETFLDEASVGV